MNDINPLNDVWININNNVDDYNNFAEIYHCWFAIKEDFDDFRLSFDSLKSSLRSLIKRLGESTNDDSDSD